MSAWRFAILAILLTLSLHPVVTEAQFTLTQITNTPLDVANFSPSINAAGTRIAFVSSEDLVPGNNTDGNAEIFLWISPGTFTQITDTSGGSNEGPSINADGTRIAFTSNRDLTGSNGDGSSEIFLWVQGSGISQITDSALASTSSESPSINSAGTRIAFASSGDLVVPPGSNADGNKEIFLWTSPSTFTQITNTNVGLGGASFFPSINADGTRISFTSHKDIIGGGVDDFGGDIFLWISPSTITQITDTFGSGQNLGSSINDDGTRITFISSRNPDGGLLDGDQEIFLWTSPSTVTQITDSAGGDSDCLSINSGGTRIAFCYNGDLAGGNADLNRELFLWIEGSGFTQITNTTGGSNESPTINADGTRIAFHSNRDLTPSSPGNADAGVEIFLASSPVGVPTLSEWAQIGMAALLVGGGLWAMRKGRLRETRL